VAIAIAPTITAKESPNNSVAKNFESSKTLFGIGVASKWAVSLTLPAIGTTWFMDHQPSSQYTYEPISRL
jgi:hypothetical protein